MEGAELAPAFRVHQADRWSLGLRTPQPFESASKLEALGTLRAIRSCPYRGWAANLQSKPHLVNPTPSQPTLRRRAHFSYWPAGATGQAEPGRRAWTKPGLRPGGCQRKRQPG